MKKQITIFICLVLLLVWIWWFRKPNNPPTIYCIMITGKDAMRHELAKKAIQNFNDQTYISKNLLIINHGKPLDVDQENIFEIVLQKDDMTLGDLRNIALELVPHDACWITWDDDDYRDPKFLSVLYDQMQKNKAEMVSITRRLEFNMNTNFIWKMTLKTGMVFCLVKKHGFFKYMSKDSMEDVELIKSYQSRGLKVVLFKNDPTLYVRLVHNNNTSLYVDPVKNTLNDNAIVGNYIEEKVNDKERQYAMKIIYDYYKNGVSTHDT